MALLNKHENTKRIVQQQDARLHFSTILSVSYFPAGVGQAPPGEGGGRAGNPKEEATRGEQGRGKGRGEQGNARERSAGKFKGEGAG